jgi:hypothetical protein
VDLVHPPPISEAIGSVRGSADKAVVSSSKSRYEFILQS